MDNIKTWTGLSLEESIRMTEDRDKWRKYVHGVANLGSRTAKEQNSSLHNTDKRLSQQYSVKLPPAVAEVTWRFIIVIILFIHRQR